MGVLVDLKPMVYCVGKLIGNLKLFVKAIDHTFYGFTGVMTHLGSWANTRRLVNHSPSARDLQAFLVFFQHPAWVITPVNP